MTTPLLKFDDGREGIALSAFHETVGTTKAWQDYADSRGIEYDDYAAQSEWVRRNADPGTMTLTASFSFYDEEVFTVKKVEPITDELGVVNKWLLTTMDDEIITITFPEIEEDQNE